MKRYTLTYLIILITAISACEIVSLPIDVDPAPTQLAVASYIGPEELLLVTVSKTFSALSATDVDSLSTDAVNALLVDRAFVTVQYEGILDTLQKVDDVPGLYAVQLQTFFDFQTMELSIFDSTTGLSVFGETQLMPAIQLDSVSATLTANPDDTTTTIYFNFQDPEPGRDNFFVFNAYNLPEINFADADSVIINNIFNSGSDLLFYERLVTDRSEGSSLIEREVTLPEVAINDSVVFVLSNVSEGYFRFLEARGRTDGLISSLSNEPVNHPTNMTNGVGYFTAHQPRSKLVATDLDE